MRLARYCDDNCSTSPSAKGVRQDRGRSTRRLTGVIRADLANRAGVRIIRRASWHSSSTLRRRTDRYREIETVEDTGDLLGGRGRADVTGGKPKLRRERRPVYRLPQNRDPSRGSLSGCRGDLLRA